MLRKMMSMLAGLRKILLVFVLLMLAPAHAIAQNLEALDDAIKARLAKSDVPGLSIAIVERDGRIVERHYGVRSVETRDPVIPGTVYQTASASKMWTAAALLRAMEQRKLSLHQPMGSFLPELRPELGRMTV